VLLTTGDVVRCTSIVAVHLSSTGLVLLDVTLDTAGVPVGVALKAFSRRAGSSRNPGDDQPHTRDGSDRVYGG